MITAIKELLIEHYNCRHILIRLAIDNTGRETLRTSFGILWLYFRDLVYFIVYTLFRILVAGNGNVEGMKTIPFVILGLIPWFFINDSLSRGSTIIRANRAIIKSIKFPVIVLPTIETISIFIQRGFTLLVAFAITIFFGYSNQINYIGWLYYIIAMFFLMLGFTMIFSAIIAISGDFQQFYLAILRVLVYSLPVIWSFDKINSPILKVALKINPIVYIIQGFRNELVFGTSKTSSLYSVYFWLIILFMLCVGAFIQSKLKKFYSDFM